MPNTVPTRSVFCAWVPSWDVCWRNKPHNYSLSREACMHLSGCV